MKVTYLKLQKTNTIKPIRLLGAFLIILLMIICIWLVCYFQVPSICLSFNCSNFIWNNKQMLNRNNNHIKYSINDLSWWLRTNDTYDPCGLLNTVSKDGISGRHLDKRFFRSSIKPSNRPLLNGDRLKSIIETVYFSKQLFDKINITFWVEGGTLLGAIRNGRLLPWDLDADFAMTNNEYYKLEKACNFQAKDEVLLGGDLNSETINDHIIPIAPWRIGFTCLKLSTKRFLVELDVGNYEIPGRVTDMLSGFYADIFIFHEKGSNIHKNLVKHNETLVLDQPGSEPTFFPKSSIFPLKNIEFEGLIVKAPNKPNIYCPLDINSNWCESCTDRYKIDSNLSVPKHLQKCYNWWLTNNKYISYDTNFTSN